MAGLEKTDTSVHQERTSDGSVSRHELVRAND